VSASSTALRPGLAPEALIEEARRHRRARRLRLLVAAIGALALAAGGLLAASAGGLLGGGGGGGGGGLAAVETPRTIVLLVDVSGSMRATDVRPNRLAAAVAALRTFVGELPAATSVGVVSFSTTAHVVQAPTTDRRRVAAALAQLAPEAGTALGTGLVTAVDLARRSAEPAAIVLESDGAQNRGPTSPLDAAGRARAAGIRVYGISLGSRTGAVRFGFGLSMNSIPVPPDPRTVRSIARATGGVSYDAATRAQLVAAYRGLAKRLS
jgi:Ca-activated chloride channel family protein